MATKIFVNLPVKNLDKSKAFYQALGYKINPQFTDDNASCVILSEEIYIMLLVEKIFLTFTSKKICNTKTSNEVINGLSAESKTEVDELIAKVLSAGGLETKPATDHGFMYERIFSDLDGHIWSIFWMDSNFVQPT